MANTTDPNGNTVVNGFATNLPANSSQANQATSNANLSVASIAPATPITIPAPTPAVPLPDLSSYTNDAATAQNEYQANLDKAKDLSSSQTNLESLLGGKVQDTNNAYQQGGVTDLAAKLRSFSAQSQALSLDNQAKTLTEENNATGNNITRTAVNRNIADATRDNTIKQANIAIQSAIAQADYTTAKSLADTMIDAKYSQIEADIKTKQDQLDALDKYTLNPSQQKAKDAQTALLKKQADDIADKKENDKDIQTLLINSSQVAPADVIARAQKIASDGGTPTAVAESLGIYGKDYLANEQLKANLAKTKAETNKIVSDQAVVQATQQTPEVASWVTNIHDGKAKLSAVPARLKSAVSFGLANAPTSPNAIKIDDYNNKLSLIGSILTSPALTSVVGPSSLGRIGYTYNKLNGQAQDFTAKVDQLTQGMTLQSLIDAKAKGATFGALSEGELNLLANSATRLNSYRKVDGSGNVYYDVDESGFKDALNEIKTLTQKAKDTEGGGTGIFIPTGNKDADNYIKSSMADLNKSMITTPAISGGYTDNQK